MEKNSGLGFMTVGLITTLLWIVVGLEFVAFIIVLIVALKVSKKKPSVEEWEEHFNDRP